MFDYNVDNFKLILLNRSEKHPNAPRSSGGVMIYVRDTFVSSDMLVFSSYDDII